MYVVRKVGSSLSGAVDSGDSWPTQYYSLGESRPRAWPRVGHGRLQAINHVWKLKPLDGIDTRLVVLYIHLTLALVELPQTRRASRAGLLVYHVKDHHPSRSMHRLPQQMTDRRLGEALIVQTVVVIATSCPLARYSTVHRTSLVGSITVSATDLLASLPSPGVWEYQLNHKDNSGRSI